ncbi:MULTISPECIES: hypothetical protein [Prochlorococcus]|uniref:hypothetical protein n=1 Tax=Prochlorococcus TaxID=1218 RepID=UPI000907D06C|nr:MULTISPECIES: hypothetical protein [Prochlorococcus]
MHKTFFKDVFPDSFFCPMITIYVVFDSQIEELKRKQHQDEFANLDISRNRLKESYQSRIKVIDEREHELQEKLKGPAPAAEKTNLLVKNLKKACLMLSLFQWPSDKGHQRTTRG